MVSDTSGENQKWQHFSLGICLFLPRHDVTFGFPPHSSGLPLATLIFSSYLEGKEKQFSFRHCKPRDNIRLTKREGMLQKDTEPVKNNSGLVSCDGMMLPRQLIEFDIKNNEDF